MPLKDYRGNANDPKLWEALVGETIVGVFETRDDSGPSPVWRWFVCDSGCAVVINTAYDSFWRARPEAVARQMALQRDRLEQVVAALGKLGTILVKLETEE